MTGVRALVVENDPFTLTSLVSALEYRRVTVVGSTTTSREALDLQRLHSPDVALLDLDLGVGPSGIDLAHALRVRQPEIGVVILSSYRDPRLVAPGTLAPPRGTLYLSKADISDFSTVVATVLAAAHGPLTARTVVPGSLPPLTAPQLEVLRLVAEGLSTQAIAQERGVSVKAVEQMIRRLSEILDLPRDGEAFMLGLKTVPLSLAKWGVGYTVKTAIAGGLSKPASPSVAGGAQTVDAGSSPRVLLEMAATG